MIDMRNRRKATRLPIEIPVEYMGKEFLGNGTVINVSPYGVLIRGDYLPIVGTNLFMRLFPSGDKEPLSVERAVVRWQRGSELGMEIISMTPEAHVRLIGLMTSVLTHHGCVCAPKLPWLCRCFAGPPCEWRSNETSGIGQPVDGVEAIPVKPVERQLRLDTMARGLEESRSSSD